MSEDTYLRALLASGTLTPERVGVAAYLGDEGAIRLIGRKPSQERNIEHWVVGLEEFGHYWVVAALAAIGTAAIHLWERRPEPSRCHHFNHQPPGEQLKLIRSWLEEPSLDRCFAATSTIYEVSRPSMCEVKGMLPCALVHDAMEETIYSIRGGKLGLEYAEDAVRHLTEAFGLQEAGLVVLVPEIETVVREAGDPLVRSAVCGSVIPLALRSQ